MGAAFFYAGAMDVFTKTVSRPDQAGAEAAGLRWLAQALAAVVVDVTEVTSTSLSTRRVEQARPSAPAARAFGAALRTVHEAGAPAFGAPGGLGGRELHWTRGATLRTMRILGRVLR